MSSWVYIKHFLYSKGCMVQFLILKEVIDGPSHVAPRTAVHLSSSERTTAGRKMNKIVKIVRHVKKKIQNPSLFPIFSILRFSSWELWPTKLHVSRIPICAAVAGNLRFWASVRVGFRVRSEAAVSGQGRASRAAASDIVAGAEQLTQRPGFVAGFCGIGESVQWDDFVEWSVLWWQRGPPRLHRRRSGLGRRCSLSQG